MIKAYIQRVIDGDTFDVILHPVPDEQRRIRLRLAGVDTPEMKGASKEAGGISTDWVRNELDGVEYVFVSIDKVDWFGRWISSVTYKKKGASYSCDLAEELLGAGMAQVYSRSTWISSDIIQEAKWE